MSATAAFADILAAGHRVAGHSPAPRVIVEEASWRAAAEGLAAGRWSLVALWGETAAVHMALLDEASAAIAVLTLETPEGTYPSVGAVHPPARRPERIVRDLFGLTPVGLPDGRPWLDHGRWGVRHPLALRPGTSGSAPYRFLPVEGEGLHEVPVGPVHAGIIEPGHFHFTVNGETVVRLEQRLGYVHKGIEGLMAGATIDSAARLAARTSGDSTVAYSLAFARALEAALGFAAPGRAQWLRALMAEMERLANHFGDIGAICNDASFALMQAHCAALREQVLRAAAEAFGHRLMMDCIVPGGVALDLTPEGARRIRELVETARRAFPPLVELYDHTASLQDRTAGTGKVRGELAQQYAAGGYVGRCAGRAFDARRSLAYAPYDGLVFDVPVRSEGDVNARVWIRIHEVEQSLGLIEQILGGMPEGAVHTPVPVHGAGEGLALVEGFRGDVFVWLSLAGDGRIARCHLRDPSLFQWPLLEMAIEGNIIADFPLCNKSFNCSYSGHDL